MRCRARGGRDARFIYNRRRSETASAVTRVSDITHACCVLSRAHAARRKGVTRSKKIAAPRPRRTFVFHPFYSDTRGSRNRPLSIHRSKKGNRH